jgi:hypothetical protein
MFCKKIGSNKRRITKNPEKKRSTPVFLSILNPKRMNRKPETIAGILI